MEYPWTRYLQLGFVVPAFFPEIRERKGPVLEIMRKASEDPFFQAMEFSGAEDPAVRRELAKIVRSSGKTLVFSGGTYCYLGQNNLHDLDEEKREKAVRNVKKIVEEAGEYGCRVLYVMGYEAPAPQDRARAMEKFARSLAALAGQAFQKGLTISVENFHILRENPFLIGPTLEFGRFLRDLRGTNPNLGLTFDTSHILQLGEDLPSTYRQVQEVIAHIHLSNCLIRDRSSPLFGDKHPPYGIPGGEIGVPELTSFLKLLQESGHFSRKFPTGKPVLSLEVITPAGQTPEENLKEAKKSFQEAWERFSGNS